MLGAAFQQLNFVFAVGVVFLLGCPVQAQTDVLIRAVGFALTGSDDAVPKVIGDRTNWVFAINNEIFHLNNVDADRITIQGWGAGNGRGG
jgi:hypothetical protein